MIKVFIPTFNRSSKLARVLRTYSLWQSPPQVFIFDGSDDPSHARANHKTAGRYDFVRYSHNILSLSERFCLFFDTCDIEDIFFVANDEDVYTESFCNLSFAMMSENKSLSSVVGSYLTFWPPLFLSLIPRLSAKKLIPRAFTLTGSFLEKISMHIALNQTTKIPPLFYSPQRISDFKEFSYLLKKSNIKYSSAELLHQFNLLVSGDVAFVPDIMLFRDETRIDYRIEPTRNGDSAYIDPGEVRQVFNHMLKRDSDLAVYLNCIYSPPILLNSRSFLCADFVSSYLAPINPMVFSDKILLRAFFRVLQGTCIRVASAVNAMLILLILPLLSRPIRYFVLSTIFRPLSVNDCLKSNL